MRLARLLALMLSVLALAACSASAPGWTYAPAPSATPLPSAEASPSGDASSEPSTPGGVVLAISALDLKFDTAELAAPAETDFQIAFQNDDPGIPHNVTITDGTGTSVFTGATFNGVDKQTYDVPQLAAGSYTFRCTIHPAMKGTLTVQ